jgi:hypothetical protein
MNFYVEVNIDKPNRQNSGTTLLLFIAGDSKYELEVLFTNGAVLVGVGPRMRISAERMYLITDLGDSVCNMKCRTLFFVFILSTNSIN